MLNEKDSSPAGSCGDRLKRIRIIAIILGLIIFFSMGPLIAVTNSPIVYLSAVIISIVFTYYLSGLLWRERAVWSLMACFIPGLTLAILAAGGEPKSNLILLGTTLKVKMRLFRNLLLPLDSLQMVAIRWPGKSKWNPFAIYSIKSQSEFYFLDTLETEKFHAVINSIRELFFDIRQEGEKNRSQALKKLMALKSVELYLSDYENKSTQLTLWDLFFAPEGLLTAFAAQHPARVARLQQWFQSDVELVIRKNSKKEKSSYFDKEGIHDSGSLISWNNVGNITAVKGRGVSHVEITPIDYQATGISKLLKKGILIITAPPNKLWYTLALIRFWQKLFTPGHAAPDVAEQDLIKLLSDRVVCTGCGTLYEKSTAPQLCCEKPLLRFHAAEYNGHCSKCGTAFVDMVITLETKMNELSKNKGWLCEGCGKLLCDGCRPINENGEPDFLCLCGQPLGIRI